MKGGFLFVILFFVKIIIYKIYTKMNFSCRRSYYYVSFCVIYFVKFVLANYFVKPDSPTFGTVVETVRADSLHTCIHKCSRHPDTDSISYDKNKKTCQLLMRNGDGDTLIQFINKYISAPKTTEVNIYSFVMIIVSI